MPQEWEKCVYSDIDLQPIVQHTEVKPILLKCEVFINHLSFVRKNSIHLICFQLSLRLWCEEYIRRIDNSFDRELRV